MVQFRTFICWFLKWPLNPYLSVLSALIILLFELLFRLVGVFLRTLGPWEQNKHWLDELLSFYGKTTLIWFQILSWWSCFEILCKLPEDWSFAFVNMDPNPNMRQHQGTNGRTNCWWYSLSTCSILFLGSNNFGASPHSYASSEMLLLAAYSLGNVGLSDQFVLSQVINCHWTTLFYIVSLNYMAWCLKISKNHRTSYNYVFFGMPNYTHDRFTSVKLSSPHTNGWIPKTANKKHGSQNLTHTHTPKQPSRPKENEA